MMEQLIPRLPGRPGEQKKVRRQKQRLMASLEPLLTDLQDWRAGGYVGFDRLPAEMQDASLEIERNRWSTGG
jgi:hypothetical protein